MKQITILLTVGILSLTFYQCKEDAKTSELNRQANTSFGVLPEKMPGSDKDTPAQIELGKKLYFEKKLSINDAQSCNSCHMVDNNGPGVDNLPTSPGAIKGQLGDRNSPTTLNAGFHFAQFWDGRAPTLEEQAKGPILNKKEMAMPDEKAVLEKLKKSGDYTGLFDEAFPGEKESLTYNNLAKAIAAFERTLVTTDRFDDFQKGDESALNSTEKEGLKLFIDKGCTQCHSGPLLGGKSLMKVGVVHPYQNSKDRGAAENTGKKSDEFLFKVPSLRNIALTQPYFHDGKVKTLEEAVNTMAWIQLGQKLNDQETTAIVAFLKTLSKK